MESSLTPSEKKYLLQLARQALEAAVCSMPAPIIDLTQLTPALRNPGASFVTLTSHGNLRGCIGALEAYQPLSEDVIEHAQAAALEDYRFPPVQKEELADLEIEISRLTAPIHLKYRDPKELLQKLRPGKDGVILRDGIRRATFLPQVWEKIGSPEDFLDHLCLKMGASPNTWRTRNLEVQVYQVEEFKEQDRKIGG